MLWVIWRHITILCLDVGEKGPELTNCLARALGSATSAWTCLSSTLFAATLRDPGALSHPWLAHLQIASCSALLVLRRYSQRNIGCAVKSEGLQILPCFPLLCFSAIISSERDPLGFLHLSCKDGVQPSEVWRLLKSPACSTVIISRHLFLLKLCTFD